MSDRDHIKNTNQAINHKKYGDNFDRIFGKKRKPKELPFTKIDIGDGEFAIQCIHCGGHTLSHDEGKVPHYENCRMFRS